MFQTAHFRVFGGLGLLLAIGCTTVVVKKDPGVHDRGIRYWRPKPYLFIGPIAQQDKPNSSTQTSDETPPKNTKDSPNPNGGPGNGSAQKTQLLTDNNFLKVAMEIKYMPDYNEEYSIRLRPGIGTGTLGIKLDDGWNLTSVNMQTDQKLPELITSIASLVGAVRGTSAGGNGSGSKDKMATSDSPSTTMNIIVDTRPDVPLGFYEPIIATGPDGSKVLFGWRYVGFMPFTGCPVAPCIERKMVECNESDLWGIVATPNSIKFQRLSEIEKADKAWPYKYKSVTKPDLARTGEDAPEPRTQTEKKDK